MRQRIIPASCAAATWGPTPPGSEGLTEQPALRRLIALLEAHHAPTARHALRVRARARLLATVLGLPAEQQSALAVAAVVHDIGKLCLPAQLLDKPGELSASEQTQLRQHPALGEHLLARWVPDQAVLQAVRHHHERFDGRGYPDGLSGAAIPLLARLLAVADCFDAMTSARPYALPRTVRAALEQIRREAGRQFDPELACAFVEAVGSGRGDGFMSDMKGPRPAGTGRRNGAERRAEARFSWGEEGAVPVVVSDGVQARWGRARDLSSGGIGLVLCCSFDPGTPVAIRLRADSASHPVERGAEVVYSRPHGAGMWWLGCAFTRPLEPAELTVLLYPPAHEPGG